MFNNLYYEGTPMLIKLNIDAYIENYCKLIFKKNYESSQKFNELLVIN